MRTIDKEAEIKKVLAKFKYMDKYDFDILVYDNDIILTFEQIEALEEIECNSHEWIKIFTKKELEKIADYLIYLYYKHGSFEGDLFDD